MDAPPSIRSIAKLLGDLEERIHDGTISVGDLLESLHERGIAMLLLLFAAPMALPVPVPPGINILLATPLLLLTAQQAAGAHTIWLPAGIRRKTLSGAKLKSTIQATLPWMRRIEKIIRPRLGFLTRDGASRFFGFLGMLMALTVCVPLPLTNTVPSLGIALMAIGFIMRDGVAVLAGAFIGTAWIFLLLICFFIFGQEAFEIIKETIKSLVTS